MAHRRRQSTTSHKRTLAAAPAELYPQPSADALLLDAYAARSCPVKTQHRFDPDITLAAPTSRAPEEGAGFAESAADSERFASMVLDEIIQMPRVVDLRPLADQDWSTRVAATAEAVAAGRKVIIAPQLPVDLAGHRTGTPDLLVLGTPTPDGEPGYYPVIIKHHQVLQHSDQHHQQRSAPLSRNLRPTLIQHCMVRATREHDLLELSHYWRMMQACGWASKGDPRGGLLGTDQVIFHSGVATLRKSRHKPHNPFPKTDRLVIAWANLDARRLRTYARTARSGWRMHSALQRYDHEFSFRLLIASSARLGARQSPGAPRVRPIVISECQTCPWWENCEQLLGPDDISLRIDKGRLDVVEIIVLRSLGIETVADLATAPIEPLLRNCLPRVHHRPGAEKRLRVAAQRADLLRRGKSIKKLSHGPVPLPPEGFSIDLDIETAANEKVYLWGFLVDDPDSGQPPHYVSFSTFDDLDNAAEQELAAQAMGWLLGQLRDHPHAMVYHYSDYEVINIRRIARQGKNPDVMEIASTWCPTNFFDLFTTARKHFLGVHGLGLKNLASDGAGFSWRDEHPGGLNSQFWFDDAVHAPTAEARAKSAQRVLDYNEDDVRATHALRAWMRTLDTEG